MNILRQYLQGVNPLEVPISSSINSDFIKSFVEEYKVMLREKKRQGDSFLEEMYTLRFRINVYDYGNEQEFDLLFISYLALFKIDFPNVDIELHFDNVPESNSSMGYFYRLAHHNVHLYINAGKSVFKLYRNGAELAYNRIIQSVSYMPPIIINKDSLTTIFKKKNIQNDLRYKLSPLLKGFKGDTIIIEQQKEPVFNRVQELYNQSRGRLDQWNSADLSALYLIKTLSELYVLRHFINVQINLKSSYQIGGSIIESKDDALSARKFREDVLNTLVSAGVFEFNDVEIFIFSLIVQNSELFKIPTSIKGIYKKIAPLLQEKEKKKVESYNQVKSSEKLLKALFIEIYTTNLRRIIDYTKDVCYGLEELAKNIVEHAAAERGEGLGVLSARIYNLESVLALKKTVPEWSRQHDSKNKFLDINVIDSGLRDVIKSYSETLLREKSDLVNIEEASLRQQLEEAYGKDIEYIGKFKLKNLFNFDSLKLLHQINRTKSRLGLLIFSQVILHDKGGLVSLSSNNIDEDMGVGYFMFRKGSKIMDVENKDFIPLGTNLNFLIPVKESFEYKSNLKKIQERSSSASSVFQELFDYGYPGEGTRYVLKPAAIRGDYNGLDKYSKLEQLRGEIGTCLEDEILLIDYNEFGKILENSSDWIRFLAGLQFTTISIKDIIIVNFEPDTYLEIINLLKLFSKPESENNGFWRKGFYILTLIPVHDPLGNIFWFNNLLSFSDYHQYKKINSDIDLYHNNLARLGEEAHRDNGMVIDYAQLDSKLFSSSKKLLNFELILQDGKGLSLFEATVTSLLQIPIDKINEN